MKAQARSIQTCLKIILKAGGEKLSPSILVRAVCCSSWIMLQIYCNCSRCTCPFLFRKRTSQHWPKWRGHDQCLWGHKIYILSGLSLYSKLQGSIKRLQHKWGLQEEGKANGQEAVMSRLFLWSVTISLCIWLPVGEALAQHATPAVAKPSASALPSSTPGAVSSPVSTMPNQMAEKSSLIVTKEYIIGPEDVLEITVWRNQDLSKVVAVRPDGRISMPLIGDVT